MNENQTYKDLRYKILIGEEFHNCNFDRAEMLGAEFVECAFYGCNFERALITGASFENCHFFECSFTFSYIFRSQFTYCSLTDCVFDKAMLSTVDFTGTLFKDVEWEGTRINSTPLIIDGIEYPVVALDNGWMHVGCHFAPMKWFYETDERESAKMEGLRARRFWKKNKKWIFDMLVARGLYVI